MLTFLVVIIVFSVLILVHELGHMFAAKRMGVKVEMFSLGMGKKLFGKKIGDTEYIISAFPLGGYVKMAGDELTGKKGAANEFYSKSPLKRFVIIVAGPLTNYIFAFILFAIVFIMGVPMLTTKVGAILPDYPAGMSGIRVGDEITQIDGEKVEYWNELVAIVQRDTAGLPLDFEVERDSKTVHFKITPKVSSRKNIFGEEVSVGMIGISPKESIVFVKHTPFEAVTLGGKRLLELTAITYKGLWRIITGGISFKESVSGPIGIAKVIGDAARAGIVSVLATMAYINMALAIFNLLPIPVLDGGHIIFLIIEKLKGRPVSAHVQEMASQIALYALIALMLFASWNDISRLLPFFNK